MSETDPRRPVGRPSEYDPAYCERVIALGKQGKSKVAMAAEFGVSKTTLDNWCTAHADFLGAMEIAMVHAQVWWEDAGQNGLKAAKFNASVWSRSMAARFPDDWREKVAHVGGDRSDPPIRHRVDLSKLTDKELEQLEQLTDKLALADGDQGGEGTPEG